MFSIYLVAAAVGKGLFEIKNWYENACDIQGR